MRQIIFYILVVAAVFGHGIRLYAADPEAPPTQAVQTGGTITLGIYVNEAEAPMNTPTHRFVQALYKAAFARIGLEFRLAFLPAERSLIESNAGRIDGQAGEDSNLNKHGAYPNLIRVDEPIIALEIAAYGFGPSAGIDGWGRLFSGEYRIGYTRGFKWFEKRIPTSFPRRLLFKCTDRPQVFKGLLAERFDLYIALPINMDRFLQSSEFKDLNIKKIGTLGKGTYFPYLHRKHARLVPELAAAIRDMKADGTYEQLVRQYLMGSP